jgi:HlyD family secretion protein
MMNELADQASASSGEMSASAMDRRIERPRAPWWRRRPVVIGAVVLMGATVFWRVVPAGGSTDMAAADVETAIVQQGRFDDALPLRASVAPRVTTLVSAMAGDRSTIWWCRTARR